MDGVIVDSHPAHRFAWREFLRTFGKEVTDNELDFIMDGRKRKDIFFHFLGPLTDERVQEYGNLKDEFFWQAAPDAVPVPGVFEFIECIRQSGITMAVATSASANRTRDTLQRLGLIETFHGSDYRRRCSRRETRSWHLSTGLPAYCYCPAGAAVAVKNGQQESGHFDTGLKCVQMPAINCKTS